ncbi:MAG TPA: polysaccharide biosynthesis tyrosine autokinase [Ignavibacteriaceae bacterium]|nr:polysaccharide biosynthesis tyrosine autokinase [Ignavibacteriaceae bacterium]
MENINFDNLFSKLNDNKTSSLRDHINLIKAHWILILVVCFIITGASVVYSLMATDIYIATTEIKVTPVEGILDRPLLPSSGELGLGSNLIANEIQTILNQTIRMNVAENLADTFKAIQNPNDFSIIINSGSSFKKGKPKLKELDEILKALSKNVSASQKENLDFIEIAVESPSPNEAALIANLYADAYREFNLSMNRNQVKTIKETLEKQRAEKLSDLIEAENNIKSYQLKGGVIQLDAQANALIGNITDFESRRYSAQIEMNSTKQTLDKLKKELSDRDPSLGEYLERTSSEPYLQQLQQQIAQQEANRDLALLNNPGQNYTEVIKENDRKIADLKEKLNIAITKYKKQLSASSPEEIKTLTQKVFDEEVKYQTLLTSHNQLGQVLGHYEEKFNNLPTRTLDLARLERERAVFEKLYLTLEEKYQEALINEQSIPGNVMVMNIAWAPGNPSKPNRLFIILLGLIAGIGIGLGYIYIKHYLDKTIKTPEDLEKNKIKFLTWIPKIRRNKKESDDEFIMLSDPDSIAGESFRALRTRIQFSKSSPNIKTILVTSSAPSEGKTFNSINLAGSFAKDEKKTIIVDCDLRKPRIHSVMKEPLIPGLSDYLFGKATLENITKMSKLTKLDFIPAGTIQGNASEILNSKKLISLFQKLRETYDIVIIDSPPILAVSDTEVLSNFVDATILVVSSNSTELDWTKQSSDLLQHGQSLFLGVILNNYDFKFGYPSSYKYHGYYYESEETKKSKKKFDRRVKKTTK